METEEKAILKEVGPDRRSGRKRKRTCCLVTIGVIVALGILMLILGLTVFKAKRPVTKIDSISLEDLDVSLDIARLRVNLNVTLDVDLLITNPNKVGFKYKNSTAQLKYRGERIGEVPLVADKISADSTKAMNITLTVMADRLLSNSQIYSDVKSGVLPLSAYAKISGKVNILKLFKVGVVTTTSCDFTIYISNRTVSDQQCTYKAKL